jgi:hypothetical protein
MRRQGFVQEGGQWITREESAARVRDREEARAGRLAAEQALEVERRMAALELYQAQQAEQPTAAPYDSSYGLQGVVLYPSYGFSGFNPGFNSHGHHGRHPNMTPGGPWRPPGQGGQHHPQGYDQLIGRVPGSLFPVGGTNFSSGGTVKRH